VPRSGWLAIGTVLGAWAVATLHPGPPAVALACAALALAVLVPRLLPTTHGGRGRSPLALVALGTLVLLLRSMAGPAPTAAPSALPEGRGPWSGTVESVASPRDGTQMATLLLEGGLRVAATVPRYPPLEPGARVVVDGRIQPPPVDDGYGAYLRRIGVAGTLRSHTLAAQPGGDGPGRVLSRMRATAAEALAAALPEPPAGLAAGILIGLRDRVARDVAADFTTAGISHIVAISGWNIAIVAATVAAVAGRAARRRRSVLTLAAIVAYVAFVGPSASVVRAAAMAGVVLLARESGRAGRGASALGLAVTLLLLADPAWISDAGFQLSSLATAGIVAWGAPLTARLRGANGGRLRGFLAETLGVSLAAQVATLPVVLLAFGRLSIVAPAVNLVVVPLVPPAMGGAALALVGGLLASAGAPAAIATILAVPGWLILGVIIATARASATLPFASLALDPAPAGLLAASVCCLLAALVSARRARGRRRGRPVAPVSPVATTRPPMERREPASRLTLDSGGPLARIAALALVLTVAVAAIAIVHRPDGATRVVVLDVGQGDAILVEGSRGGRLLVDGGPDPDRLLAALDARVAPWDRRIDVVVLTHPHEDHVAGIPLLAGRYRIGRILDPGMRGTGPGYAALTSWTRTGGPPRSLLAAGDRLRVDDALLHVLWPDAGTVPVEPAATGVGINNVSIVLLGEVAGRRFLLTGDIEEEIDPILLARGLPPVDLLKVAHHGSRTASTEAFLAAVRPAIAVVSAGARNRYGHPAPATLERLTAAGARVLRTDRDGTVEVRFEQGQMRVAASGPSRRADAGTPAELDGAADTAIVTQPTGRTVDAAGFLCGLPERAPLAATMESGADARTSAEPWTGPRDGAGLLYHRADDGPRAAGGRRSPSLPGSPRVVPAAFARRRRGGVMAGGPDQRCRDTRGPTTRGVGRPAARRGQAAARARSGLSPPPRRRVRSVACPPGPPRARPGRRAPSGHAAGGW
jgi:competence protein ComEC